MQDYKKKYMELRSKYMKDLETSWQLGYQKGSNDASMQAQMQQVQMQQDQMVQAQQAQMQGTPQEGQISPEEQQMMEQQQSEQGQEPEQNSELDQHINELQQMLGKGERPSYVQLREVTEKIAEMRKSEYSKKLPKLEPEQKKDISLQKRIVNDVLSKWRKESQETINDIIGELK